MNHKIVALFSVVLAHALSAQATERSCGANAEAQLSSSGSKLDVCVVSDQFRQGQDTILVVSLSPSDGVEVSLYDPNNLHKALSQETGLGDELALFKVGGERVKYAIRDWTHSGRVGIGIVAVNNPTSILWVIEVDQGRLVQVHPFDGPNKPRENFVLDSDRARIAEVVGDEIHLPSYDKQNGRTRSLMAIYRLVDHKFMLQREISSRGPNATAQPAKRKDRSRAN